ncbi:hypothetical protein HP550_17720 [Cellulomonas humilata]|uniref:Uncharacterized protein n=1 Tax=Cellulomonas humilata TaxID=144055 RepID=A0A7Y6DZ52_9CELL|nr:hypothetical protein [Cellulomonas humilata]NUU19090.1 hypothetical protein [Cellulomonas humilata]
MAVGTRRDVLRASVLTLVVPVAVVVAVMIPVSLVSQAAEGWDGLGTALVGMAVAAVLGVVALVVTASVAFGRVLPRGQRWRPALAAVAGVLTPTIVSVGPLAWGGTGTKLCLLSLTVLLPLAVTGHVRRRWVAVAVVAAVVLGFVEAGAQRWGQDRERRAELARFAGALPLTDGRSLDSPLPGGWAYLSTSLPYPGYDQPLRMQWRRDTGTAGDGNYVVATTTERTDCAPLRTEPTCTVIGRGPHGDITRSESGYVFVRVDEVEWRVESYDLEDADAVVVLDRLEPVDADAFLRAAQGTTGSF